MATFVAMVIVLFAFIQFGNKMDGQKDTKRQSPAPLEIGLHEAVIKGDLKAVQQHIEMGTNIDEREEIGGATGLISAAFFGKTDIAVPLVEEGADLDLQNNEGSTALHTAAFFGRVEIVESLLNHAANKSITNNSGSTPFQSVAGNFESVRPIYEYFENAYASLGLLVDYDQLKSSRPAIAKMLLDTAH